MPRPWRLHAPQQAVAQGGGHDDEPRALLQVGMMPTARIEDELRSSYEMRRAMGETVSEPAGVVVMRRGKLGMRVGMGLEEFTQLVVYQAAAQLSLERIGYKFDE
jgi:hypothetical protein